MGVSVSEIRVGLVNWQRLERTRGLSVPPEAKEQIQCVYVGGDGVAGGGDVNILARDLSGVVSCSLYVIKCFGISSFSANSPSENITLRSCVVIGS